MKQTVIVIGNNYATRLGVIRSVGLLGCDVVVIHVVNSHHGSYGPKPIDCYSKYVSQFLFFNRSDGEEGMVKLLLEKFVDDSIQTIIIPTSDFSALAIDNDTIKKHFHVPCIHNEINSIGFWMDKANQKELALRVGLDSADSVVIEKREKGYEMPDGIRYPCFTKPIASIGAGKKCLQRCDNAIALQKVLEIAEKNGIQKILVEDYIDIEQEYAIIGFSDGNDVVIPGIIEFQRECQSHKGIAMTGKVMPIDRFEELIELFKIFIRQLGFVGLFDIDFFKSKGKFYFDELNLRMGGSGTAISSMGINTPVMFVKKMLDESIDDMSRFVTNSASFLNERMAMDDFLSGKMSIRDYLRLIKSADIHFVKDEIDIVPYKELCRVFRRNVFNYKRVIKQVFHILKTRTDYFR